MRRALTACVAFLIIGVIFCANPFLLSAQSYGERIDISTMTFPSTKVFAEVLNSQGTATVVWGYLKLPSGSAEHIPAVVLAHGCGGIARNTDGWVAELNRAGIATFVLDSFTGRGVKEICTGHQSVAQASRLVDVYRSLAMLATRPQIDPRRIALMGFSQGANVTLFAATLKFQRAWMPQGDYQFAAYLAFYPGCVLRLDHEDQVADRPIRVYHGSADDYTPLNQCARYVDRMRQAGKDVELTVYPGAYHAFDSPGPVEWHPALRNPTNCNLVELPDGRFVMEPGGRPYTPGAFGSDPCWSTGAHNGGNPDARRKAVQDVTAFLRQLFKLGQ